MRIGILTFHWATNYGAILQAYCLQEFLTSNGHEVDIINYKPLQYDFSWKKYIKNPKAIKTIFRDISNKKKEKLLSHFREQYLHTTRRFYYVNDIKPEVEKYDVLISGSDQVLNPSFTLGGEVGKPSPAYWLCIDSSRKDIKRIGYAVSFGCENYPKAATMLARQWVSCFDAIGVREITGLNILEQLGYTEEKTVLPDPTLLLGKNVFEKLGIVIQKERSQYTCVYMLRHEFHMSGNVKYIDERHSSLTMEQWLSAIVGAGKLITNSYHGMIIALLSHVPFAVLQESGNGAGMNDRFYTLLKRLGLESRIAFTIEDTNRIFLTPIDFKEIDKRVIEYRSVGIDFLTNHIKVRE